MRWRWRWRKGYRGRPFSELFLYSLPSSKRFIPDPCLNPEPIELSYPEYEALRLVDFEGLIQEEAAKRMGTSRGTIWRLVSSGRKKLLDALVNSRPIILTSKGEVIKETP
ncbi:MAG: DUF134 domain-containing protein [Candidatus Bathyarchaeia archaeon]